jgi:uncharacterized membrane protein YeaQ/YmgE (transglycosylase-associated protein family)
MAYVIWPLIGLVIAMLLSTGPQRRITRPNANPAYLAGAFGALIGGVIGDGLPHALAGRLTVSSVIGAIIGALIFCWAVHGRASDAEP